MQCDLCKCGVRFAYRVGQDIRCPECYLATLPGADQPLLDFFAGCALAGHLARAKSGEYSDLAKAAYFAAESMLAERNRRLDQKHAAPENSTK